MTCSKACGGSDSALVKTKRMMSSSDNEELISLMRVNGAPMVTASKVTSVFLKDWLEEDKGAGGGLTENPDQDPKPPPICLLPNEIATVRKWRNESNITAFRAIMARDVPGAAEVGFVNSAALFGQPIVWQQKPKEVKKYQGRSDGYNYTYFLPQMIDRFKTDRQELSEQVMNGIPRNQLCASQSCVCVQL